MISLLNAYLHLCNFQVAQKRQIVSIPIKKGIAYERNVGELEVQRQTPFFLRFSGTTVVLYGTAHELEQVGLVH